MSVRSNRTARATAMASVLAVGLFTVFVGCAPTTYETSASTTVVAATTTIPTGPVDELLPRLRQTMLTLSSFIGPNASGSTTSGKNEVLAEIEALWSAAETEVTSLSPESAESIGRMVDLARTAVERNRPADADKAAKFAGAVIDQLLG
ncbi:unannotated protein [freshwater metagenome]|jgi:hypothetical protein|uniref:Unannotated protein n=1 Tax=freshwater metagenome TaxID=449393 RepID=A0A6J6EM15_9ZZZZ|nr:hypothetical protein [Actinomycetota bacterium]